MALDFPNNPANGDVYPYSYTIDLNGTTFFREVDYVYSAAKDSWTGTITQSTRISKPDPSDVVASPPFSNAADLDAVNWADVKRDIGTWGLQQWFTAGFVGS